MRNIVNSLIPMTNPHDILAQEQIDSCVFFLYTDNKNILGTFKVGAVCWKQIWSCLFMDQQDWICEKHGEQRE